MSGIIQVVGVTGFIGQHVFTAISGAGNPVVGTSRKVRKFANIRVCSSAPACSDANNLEDDIWVYEGVGAVVFCAGLAHVQKPSADDIAAFEQVNVDLPVRYAQAAIAAGVRRFLYISSIGVHGEGSSEPYSENSGFAPSDEYSRSKVVAERELTKLFRGTDSELVIIRPPMVYGPNAPGNFSRLASLVRKGLPLPFGGLSNPRSFISIQNLVSFLVCCIDHPNAGGEVFVVSDNDDTTPRDFIREIAKAQKLPITLVPVHIKLFVFGLTLIGHGKTAKKLSAPFTIDCSHAIKTLNWRPPYTFQESIDLAFND